MLLAYNRVLLAVVLVSCSVAAQEIKMDQIDQLTLVASDADIYSVQQRVDAVTKMATLEPRARVLPVLIRCLQDKDAFVRAAAARGIGKLGAEAKDALPVLQKMLVSDSDVNVKLALVEALKQVGTGKDLVTQLLPLLEVQDKATLMCVLGVLKTMGKDAQTANPKLLGLLKQKDPEIAATAMKVLGATGGEQEILSHIVPALSHDEAAVRQAAEDALVSLKEQAWPLIKEKYLVNTKDERLSLILVRLAVSRMNLSPQEALLAHKMLMEKGTADERVAAIGAVGRMGPNGVTIAPELTNLWDNDKDPRTKVAIANAVAQIRVGVNDLLPRLCTGLMHDEPTVRQAAEQTLLSLKESSMPSLLKMMSDGNEQEKAQAASLIMQIAGQSPEGLEAATVLLESGSSNQKISTAGRVAFWGKADDRVIKALAIMLADGDKTIRAASAHALGCLSTDAIPTIPAIIACLKDAEPEVHDSAKVALRRLGGIATEELSRNLSANDTALTLECARILVSNDQSPVQAIVDSSVVLLKDGDTKDVSNVVALLNRVGDTGGKTVPALIARLASDNSKQQEAIRGLLYKLPAPPSTSVPELVNLLKSDKPIIRSATLQAIGRMGPNGKEALEAVKSLVTDSDADVKQSALLSLADIAPGDSGVIEACLKGLEDKNYGVQQASVKALGKLGTASPAAVSALLKTAQTADKNLLVTIAETLEALDIYAYQSKAMLERVVEKNNVASKAAEKALKSMATPTVSKIPLYVQSVTYPDPEVRLLAAKAVEELGPRAAEASGAMVALLADNDKRVVVEARNALLSIGSAALPALQQAIQDKRLSKRVSDVMARIQSAERSK